MARYRRRDQIEIRVADALDAAGSRWSADLIAKRATGVPGYRMTLAFLELEGDGSAFVEIDPAPSREEAEARGEALAADPVRLARLLQTGRGG
jgi:hypothetical protein